MVFDRRRFIGTLLAGAALVLPSLGRAEDQPANGDAGTKLTLSVPGMT